MRQWAGNGIEPGGESVAKRWAIGRATTGPSRCDDPPPRWRQSHPPAMQKAAERAWQRRALGTGTGARVESAARRRGGRCEASSARRLQCRGRRGPTTSPHNGPPPPHARAPRSCRSSRPPSHPRCAPRPRCARRRRRERAAAPASRRGRGSADMRCRWGAAPALCAPRRERGGCAGRGGGGGRANFGGARWGDGAPNAWGQDLPHQSGDTFPFAPCTAR